MKIIAALLLVVLAASISVSESLFQFGGSKSKASKLKYEILSLAQNVNRGFSTLLQLTKSRRNRETYLFDLNKKH
jgi:hypothetical protein